MTNLDQLTGAQWPIPVIALPIGISFYTFTQIAFLVDTFRGAESTLRVTDYFLFVAYFPHLVAGPIIHHAQTIPQFRRMARDAWDATDVAVGLAILTIGMFRKLVIVDSVAPFADAALTHTPDRAGLGAGLRCVGLPSLSPGQAGSGDRDHSCRGSRSTSPRRTRRPASPNS